MENARQIERLNSHNSKLDKDNNKLDRYCKGLELDKRRMAEDKLNAINEKTVAKNAVSALTREIEWLNKQTETELNNIISLVRDRDKMKKDLQKVEAENQQNKKDISSKQAAIVNLKLQVAVKTEHVRELLANSGQLEKQRDKYCQEASKANANLMQMIEEVKLKKNIIGELKKENIEREAKYKQQQNLYEAVRSDRNLYSKNLIESQDEVAELRRKFKIAAHQIQQLKDEIESKDIALTAKDHAMGEEKKHHDNDKAALGHCKTKLTALEDIMKTTENEKTQYKYMLAETEKQNEASKKEYQNVVDERDILGTQLIRRNDELALLYEKIKILQTTLSKGESQYNERLEDIKLLKYKIGDLKCELRIVTSKAAEIKGLKDEIVNLNKQLLTEKL
jgi:chromosome segregation ATPase